MRLVEQDMRRALAMDLWHQAEGTSMHHQRHLGFKFVAGLDELDILQIVATLARELERARLDLAACRAMLRKP